MEASKVMILLIANVVLFLSLISVSKADCQPNAGISTIFVGNSGGRGHFRTIQSAIDSISFGSSRWTRIQISPGIFREKVTIPKGKTCIFLDGAGDGVTEIQWNDHTNTSSSATFTSFADNLAIRGIRFTNTFNAPGTVRKLQDIAPALAALIAGDKVAIHSCGFVGLQDTLWDGVGTGRHFYKRCYIEGVIDFIAGSGQSIFEKCHLFVSIAKYQPVLTFGFITAQERDSPKDTNGFVFKRCTIDGSGRAYLGRAYRLYSRVIHYRSFFTGLIDPAGWAPWQPSQPVNDVIFVEAGCTGPGADTSRRVPWLKKLSSGEILSFERLSYIDQDGWISRLPFTP